MAISKNLSIMYLVVYFILQICNLSYRVEADSGIHAQADLALSSAVFGSNGLTVDMSFSGNTNKGGKSLSFGCVDLFTFTGNSQASCLWLSASSVRITLSASATQLVGVLSIVTVKANTIRPASDLTVFIPVSSVAIAKSPTATVPKVFISAPKVAGTCDSPAIDVTTSTGSCGRNWKSAVLAVDSIPLAVTLGDHSIFPPIVIPVGMLTAGYYYSFSYTLCNFMDVCSTSVHRMYATDKKTPIVLIQGQATRDAVTKNSLLLTADGFTANCDGTSSSSDVVFSWRVLANGVPTSKIVSISSDSKKFKVAPYALTPLVQYKFIVTGSSLAEGTNASSFVTISVKQSDLVLVTSGGTQQSARIGEPIVIDVSGSYDSDYAPGSGITQLKHEFECALLPLTIPTTCDLTLVRLPSSLRITPLERATVGGTHVIKITVFDLFGHRNSSKNVYITTAKANAPVVNVMYSSAAKINPTDSLKLLGTVQSTVSSTARWVLSNPGPVVLSLISQTTIEKSLGAGTKSFNLVVGANSLAGREAPYVFSLYADTTYSSIEVTINTPPSVGIIGIVPPTGKEMDTRFVVEASRWVDADMPLTYQFGYENPKDGSIMIVRGRAEIAFADTSLPSGGASRNNLITCTVKVFDFLNAFSVGSKQVTVTKLNITASALESLVMSNLDSAAGDIDSTKEVLSVATSVVNNQDCRSLPYDCATELFREGCYDTPNTCGQCLAGYTGSEGDDNSVCVEVAVRRAMGVSSMTGCITDSDCASAWDYCNSDKQICMTKAKECNNGCSGRGKCVMLGTDSGTAFSGDCLMGMTSCKATCMCDTSFHGDTCDMNADEYAAKLALRETLLTSLTAVALLDDPSRDAIEGWLMSVNAMATSTQEMSEAASAKALNLAEYILDNAETMHVPYSVIIDLLKAISVANQAGTMSDTLKTIALLDKFNEYVASNMLEGQDAMTSIQASFRALTQILSGSGSTVGSTLPLTNAEELAGVVASSVSIDSIAGSMVSVSVSSMKSSQYNGGSGRSASGGKMVGNPMRANIAAASTQQVTFTLQNSEVQPYYSTPGVMHRTICLEEDYTHTPYTCNNGDTGTSILWHNCTGGESRIIESPCPTVSFEPSCELLNEDAVYVCTVQSFTPTQTVCQCDRTDDPSSRRRVLRTNRNLLSEELEDSGAIEVVGVSNLIAQEFATTVITAGDLTLGDLQDAVIIFILYAALWGGGMLGLSICTLRRRKLTKISGLVRHELLKKKQTATSAKSSGAVKKYMLSYINEIFPAVYRHTDSFFMRGWTEICKHHKYLILFTAKGRNSENVRMLTGVYLLTMQTLLMFILAVCYDLEYPQDDGTCLTYETSDTCASEKSVFDHTKAKCAWTNPDSPVVEYVDNESIGGMGFIPSCVFVNPVFTVQTVIILSIIAAIITAPLNYVIDFLFWSVISAPTADSLKLQAQDSLLNRTARNAGRRMSNVGAAVASAGRRMSNAVVASVPQGRRKNGTFLSNIQKSRGIPDSAVEAQVLATASFSDIIDEVKTSHKSRNLNRRKSRQTFLSQKLSESSNSLGSVPGKIDYNRMSTSLLNSTDPTVDELFDEMVVDMMQQRSHLLPSQTRTFDREWGLVNGEMDCDSSVVFAGTCCSKTSVSRMEEVIKSELEFVQKESHVKHEKLRLATDQQVGLEILHLFVLDLLGRDTPVAKIFLSKSEEDFRHEMVMTPQVKIVAWIVVVLLNFFFIFFSLLRGIQRGTEWQRLFAMACVLQFFIEIFFYETTECALVNFLIPDLVKKEVVAVGDALRQTITKVCDAKYGPTGSGLVAVDHDSPFSSPRGVSPRMSSMNGDDLCLDAPQYLFVSQGVAKKFPNLVESVIVQSYHTYSPGELSKKWVRRLVGGGGGGGGREGDAIEEEEDSGDVANCLMGCCPWAFSTSVYPATNRIGLTFGITFIFFQLMIHFGASSPRLQRIIINSLQPMVFAGIVLTIMFIANNPAYLAVIGIIVLYKGHYYYRENQMKEALKEEKMSLLAQEDEDEDEDEEDDLESGRGRGRRTTEMVNTNLTASNLHNVHDDRSTTNSAGSTTHSSQHVPSLNLSGVGSTLSSTKFDEDNHSSEGDHDRGGGGPSISLSLPKMPKLPSEVSNSSDEDSSDDSSDDEDDGRGTVQKQAVHKGGKAAPRRPSENPNLAFNNMETIYSNNNSVQNSGGATQHYHDLSDEDDDDDSDYEGLQIRHPSNTSL